MYIYIYIYIYISDIKYNPSGNSNLSLHIGADILN